MKKILPYYKGECIAKTPLGYTNVTNARKRMDDYDVKKDFEKTLPKDYWYRHYYTYRLKEPWSKDIRPGQWNTSTSVGRFSTEYYTRGYVDHDTQVYFDNLPKSTATAYRILEETNDRDEYRTVLYTLLENGWMPVLWKDMKDYDKRYLRFIKENVEFREVEIEVTATPVKR